jgi:hypothetical protein
MVLIRTLQSTEAAEEASILERKNVVTNGLWFLAKA